MTARSLSPRPRAPHRPRPLHLLEHERHLIRASRRLTDQGLRELLETLRHLPKK